MQTNKETVGLEVQAESENKIDLKKAALAVVLFVVVVIATVSVSRVFMDSQYIGEEKAKEIALFHANSSFEDVNEYRCEMNVDEDGVVVYKIFCSTSNGVYDFVLDGKTGDLIKYNYAEYGQQVTDENIS